MVWVSLVAPPSLARNEYVTLLGLAKVNASPSPQGERNLGAVDRRCDDAAELSQKYSGRKEIHIGRKFNVLEKHEH